MSKRSPAGELAREYVARFPATENRQLAKMLCQDHPQVFYSLNQARTRIRYYRSAQGEHHRDAVAEKQFHTPKPRIPPSDAESWEPYELPDITATWAVFADLHCPYHDVDALTQTVKHAKARGVDSLLFLGDVNDCHELSSFEKSPLRRRFREEIDVTQDLIEGIRDYLQPERTIWKAGNHEDRYRRYLWKHAPALFGVENFEWDRLWDLEKRDIVGVGDQRIITAGKLALLHGDEYIRNMLSPVNPARGVFLRGHECALVAHSHIPSSHSEKTFLNRVISTWSMGCLCDLHPQYARLNRWQHGYAIVHTMKREYDDLDWEVENFKLVNGRMRHA